MSNRFVREIWANAPRTLELEKAHMFTRGRYSTYSSDGIVIGGAILRTFFSENMSDDAAITWENLESVDDKHRLQERGEIAFKILSEAGFNLKIIKAPISDEDKTLSFKIKRPKMKDIQNWINDGISVGGFYRNLEPEEEFIVLMLKLFTIRFQLQKNEIEISIRKKAMRNIVLKNIWTYMAGMGYHLYDIREKRESLIISLCQTNPPNNPGDEFYKFKLLWYLSHCLSSFWPTCPVCEEKRTIGTKASHAFTEIVDRNTLRITGRLVISDNYYDKMLSIPQEMSEYAEHVLPNAILIKETAWKNSDVEPYLETESGKRITIFPPPAKVAWGEECTKNPPSSGMTRVQMIALGGGQEIGANCFLYKIGNISIVVDAGMSVEEWRNPGLPPLENLEKVDLIAITHSHLDHMGALPYLSAMFPEAPIITPKRNEVLLKSVLAHYNNPFFVQKSIESDETKNITYFTNLSSVWKNIVGLDEYCEYKLPKTEDLSFSFNRAGHLYGAGVLNIRIKDHSIIHTGDFCFEDQFTVKGLDLKELSKSKAGILEKEKKTLVMESTYGLGVAAVINRTERYKKLVSILSTTLSREDSVCLIPTFALGRTQEVYSMLIEAIKNKDIPHLKHDRIFIGGFGKDLITKGVFPFDCSMVNFFGMWDLEDIVYDIKNDYRTKIPPRSVIITTSGMMVRDSLSYKIAREMLRKEYCTIILAGYQARNTPGGILEKCVKEKDFTSRKVFEAFRLGYGGKIKCKVHKVPLSAHADIDGLTKMVEKLNPNSVTLMHGDRNACENLSKHLKSNLPMEKQVDVSYPSNLEVNDLFSVQINLKIQDKDSVKLIEKTHTPEGTSISQPFFPLDSDYRPAKKGDLWTLYMHQTKPYVTIKLTEYNESTRVYRKNCDAKKNQKRGVVVLEPGIWIFQTEKEDGKKIEFRIHVQVKIEEHSVLYTDNGFRFNLPLSRGFVSKISEINIANEKGTVKNRYARSSEGLTITPLNLELTDVCQKLYLEICDDYDIIAENEIEIPAEKGKVSLEKKEKLEFEGYVGEIFEVDLDDMSRIITPPHRPPYIAFQSPEGKQEIAFTRLLEGSQTISVQNKITGEVKSYPSKVNIYAPISWKKHPVKMKNVRGSSFVWEAKIANKIEVISIHIISDAFEENIKVQKKENKITFEGEYIYETGDFPVDICANIKTPRDVDAYFSLENFGLTIEEEFQIDLSESRLVLITPNDTATLCFNTTLRKEEKIKELLENKMPDFEILKMKNNRPGKYEVVIKTKEKMKEGIMRLGIGELKVICLSNISPGLIIPGNSKIQTEPYLLRKGERYMVDIGNPGFTRYTSDERKDFITMVSTSPLLEFVDLVPEDDAGRVFSFSCPLGPAEIWFSQRGVATKLMRFNFDIDRLTLPEQTQRKEGEKNLVKWNYQTAEHDEMHEWFKEEAEPPGLVLIKREGKILVGQKGSHSTSTYKKILSESTKKGTMVFVVIPSNIVPREISAAIDKLDLGQKKCCMLAFPSPRKKARKEPSSIVSGLSKLHKTVRGRYFNIRIIPSSEQPWEPIMRIPCPKCDEGNLLVSVGKETISSCNSVTCDYSTNKLVYTMDDFEKDDTAIGVLQWSMFEYYRNNKKKRRRVVCENKCGFAVPNGARDIHKYSTGSFALGTKFEEDLVKDGFLYKKGAMGFMEILELTEKGESLLNSECPMCNGILKVNNEIDTILLAGLSQILALDSIAGNKALEDGKDWYDAFPGLADKLITSRDMFKMIFSSAIRWWNY